jgi:hypothetical protein
MSEPTPEEGLARRVRARMMSPETVLIVFLAFGTVLGLLFSPGIGGFAVWVPVIAAAILFNRWLSPVVDAIAAKVSDKPETQARVRIALTVLIAAATLVAGACLVVALVPKKP